MPGAEAYEARRRQTRVPGDVPTELAPLYTPLLSSEQEQHLFRQMNFLKHRIARLRGLLHFPTRGMCARGGAAAGAGQEKAPQPRGGERRRGALTGEG
jgi:hypothetical protein